MIIICFYKLTLIPTIKLEFVLFDLKTGCHIIRV